MRGGLFLGMEIGAVNPNGNHFFGPRAGQVEGAELALQKFTRSLVDELGEVMKIKNDVSERLVSDEPEFREAGAKQRLRGTAPERAGRPFNDLFSTTAALQALPESISHALKDKLRSNAHRADLLWPVSLYASHRLRNCRPGRYLCRLYKFCAVCSLNRTTRFVRQRRQQLRRLELAYHLTLTSYPTTVLTKSAVLELKRRFRLLRDRKSFSRVIRGGLANFQVKRTNDGTAWLVHLHAVVDCNTTPSVSLIQRDWHSLGGGQQVGLDRITPGQEANTFAYSTRPMDLPGLSSSACDVKWFYHATLAVQLTVSWGTLFRRGK